MKIHLLAILFSLAFILVVLDLVRRRKLKEQYSLLWLGVGALFILLSVSTRTLEGMASLLGIHYAPSLLFLFGLLFSFALILHLTVVASRLTDRVVRLAQEVSLLKASQQRSSRYTSDKDVVQ